MVDIFTAGGIIIDNVVAADGTINRGAMGGNAVYSAAGARLWMRAFGLGRVGLVGVVPRNYPAAWLNRLDAAGIDTSGVHEIDEDVTLGEWFFYAPDGSRTDHLHATTEAAAANGLTGGVASRDAIDGFVASLRANPPAGRSFGAFRRDNPVTMVHVPPAFLKARGAHLPANRPDAHTAMAQALRRPGFTVTVDPGSNAAHFAQAGPASLPLADIFLPSERELLALTAAGPLSERLHLLTREAYPIVACKLAARGSLIAAGHDDPIPIPSLPVLAVDPTGAGDAFCGGFLAGYLITGDAIAAACFGTVSASFAVEAFGPFHLAEAPADEAQARLTTLIATLPEPLAHTLAARFEAAPFAHP